MQKGYKPKTLLGELTCHVCMFPFMCWGVCMILKDRALKRWRQNEKPKEIKDDITKSPEWKAMTNKVFAPTKEQDEKLLNDLLEAAGELEESE